MHKLVVAFLFLSALVLPPAHAVTVTETLAGAGLWVIAPPKSVVLVPEVTLDLAACDRAGLVSEDSAAGRVEARRVANCLSAAACLSFRCEAPLKGVPGIRLGVFPDGSPRATLPGITEADLEALGSEGYALHVDASGVSLAARDWPGLHHGAVTLSQLITDRKTLPGLHLRDWPAMRYRGVQEDISRGQMPTPDTLARLTDVLSGAHCNVLELYIEDVFKFQSHPDSSPPEGMTPEEARALFSYAADQHIEVHPLFQVLGHSFNILSKPQYQHLRVGPCEKQPWIMTYDVRKPEAVAFVQEMLDELCAVFPGELFNVDITEIDCDGMLAAGMSLEDVTNLVYEYVLKLNDMVQRHGMRLMIAQGPLDSTGHLAGMGPKLETLPKSIIVGSYYCAGGPYAPAWERDFPRLQAHGTDFFAQAWIGSQLRVIPSPQHAFDFSDKEVTRGLQYGAIGSITTDWGDDGHYHFAGQNWFTFLYHGACAWAGTGLDRDYFNESYSRLIHGATDGSIARAFCLSGDISNQTIKTLQDDGTVTDAPSTHFWEFFGDPFTHKSLTGMADPGTEGTRILKQADEAVALLQAAQATATRNKDNLEQMLFGARNYQAMGHKLVALAHYRDAAYARDAAATELEAVATEYEELKADFQRMWIAEDKKNAGFQVHVDRFDWTIASCRAQAAALRAPAQ